MALLNMLHLTPYQMGNLTLVSDASHRLEPRIATGGAFVGHGFLALAVLLDPEQEVNRDALLMLDLKTIDTDVAFPAPDNV